MLLALTAMSTAVVACPTKHHYEQESKPPVASPSPSPEPYTVPSAAPAVVEPPISPSAAVSADVAPVSPDASSSSSSTSSSGSISGKSTFYGGNLAGGTCSFTTMNSIPNGLNGTAYSGQAWNNGAMCGACIEVTRGSKSITAMIVDKCPECAVSHLDLFQAGFLELGTASEGIIPTSYKEVDCGITSPLVLNNKSGTSPYWFSMQVVNANGAVTALDVSTDGGSTWQSTTRTDYNFFEQASGFGTDAVTVRVTGASGKTVTVDNVKVASGAQTTASGNV
ncbi:unnamed protein product [Discula destructiva]